MAAAILTHHHGDLAVRVARKWLANCIRHGDALGQRAWETVLTALGDVAGA